MMILHFTSLRSEARNRRSLPRLPLPQGQAREGQSWKRFGEARNRKSHWEGFAYVRRASPLNFVGEAWEGFAYVHHSWT